MSLKTVTNFSKVSPYVGPFKILPIQNAKVHQYCYYITMCLTVLMDYDNDRNDVLIGDFARNE
jgi:hypothetical protein